MGSAQLTATFFFFFFQVGQILVSVDGESLLDVTHKEAVNLIRALYRDKTKPHMELVVADAV